MHIQLLTNMQIKLTNYDEVLVQKVGMHQKSQNGICSPEILMANAFCPKTSFSSKTITKISGMLQKQNCSHLPPNLDVLPPFCIISRAGHNRNVVDTKKWAARPDSYWVIAHVHHMHRSVYFHTPFCYELPVRQLPSSEAQSSHVACKYVSSHPPTIVRISTKSFLHVGCRCFQITYVR